MKNVLATLALAAALAPAATLTSCNAPGAAPAYADVQFPPPPTGIAPQPYTAEQIRASNPTGTICEYYITQTGMSPILQTFEWAESYAEGCRMNTTMVNAGGGDPATQSSEATWSELRDHASFAAATTVRTEEVIRTPAGQFACWRYDFQQPASGRQQRETYWFDKRTAGSPVLIVAKANGEEVMRMELQSTNRVEF